MKLKCFREKKNGGFCYITGAQETAASTTPDASRAAAPPAKTTNTAYEMAEINRARSVPLGIERLGSFKSPEMFAPACSPVTKVDQREWDYQIQWFWNFATDLTHLAWLSSNEVKFRSACNKLTTWEEDGKYTEKVLIHSFATSVITLQIRFKGFPCENRKNCLQQNFERLPQIYEVVFVTWPIHAQK